MKIICLFFATEEVRDLLFIVENLESLFHTLLSCDINVTIFT